MSPQVKTGLIGLGTFLAASALNYVIGHLTSFGVPAAWLPAISALLPLITHYLPTPQSMASSANTVSTSGR